MSYLYDVFISYARKDDKEFVKQLYEDLTKEGFKVWWDIECMPSRSLTFLQEIRDAIDNSQRLIAVVGPKAVESDYVLQEWIWASQFGNGILPILRLGDYDLLNAPKAQGMIANFHCPDFRSDDKDIYARHFAELCKILAKPMKSLAMLYKVPALPPHFQYRKNDLDALLQIVLADVRKPTLRKSAPRPLVVHGMGGIGKSVLASALARTMETRRSFTNGIFWVTIGQKPDLLECIFGIERVFNEDLSIYNDLNDAQTHLIKDLYDKKALIILDDVWEISHVEPFLNAMGVHCRLMITTRDRALATALEAQEHPLGTLDEEDAIQFLADWIGMDKDSLPQIALDIIEECGNHAFALALAGAMYKEGTPWKDLYEALCEADLQFMEKRFPNYGHTDVFRMIKVGIDLFKTRNPNKAKYYDELVVFRPEIIPEHAVLVLWTRNNELKERVARQLLITLNNQSLLHLEGRPPNSLVSLHDLLYDFLCASIDDLTELRKMLLLAYKDRCPEGWHTGPNDGYFFQHIGFLLMKLNYWEELVNTLTDLRYIETCSKNDLLHILIRNYSDLLLSDNLSEIYMKKILEFKRFVLNQAQVLQTYPNLTVQQALNQPNNSLPSQEGRKFIESELKQFSRPWIEWINKPDEQDPCILTFTGHSGGVYGCAFSPDGMKVVSASGDTTLKLWEVETGAEIRTFTGHSSVVNGCTFSPDGTRVVSASGDTTLKLWDVETGAEIRTFTGHSSPVNECVFSPDGTKVVSASNDGSLKLWEVETGVEIRTFTGHSDWINGCAFSPDGMKLVSASQDGTLKLWEVETGAEIRTFTGHSDWINGCAFSPDGTKVVSISFDSILKLWEVETGAEIRTFTGHSNWVYGGVWVNRCAFSPDGTKVISASGDTTLKLWEVETGVEMQTFTGHSKFINGCAFSPDGTKVVSASGDATLKLWEVETGGQIRTFMGHYNWINGCVFSPDGTKIVSASGDTTLKLWDVETRGEIRTFTGHSDEVYGCAFSPDGTKIVSVSGDKTLKLWEVETGAEIRTFTGHSDWVNGCAFSPDGMKLVSASQDGTLKLWEVETGAEIRTFTGHTLGVYGCIFCPDGNKLVSASDDGTLKLWEVETGIEIRTFMGHSRFVHGCAFSPDGTKLVSASGDTTLKLWDVETGAEIRTFAGHSDRVNGCAFSPDGTKVVSVSGDKTLKLWDVRTGNELITFPTLRAVYSVAVGEKSLATGDGGGRLYILLPHDIN